MELELVRRSSPLSSSISALALFFSLLADYPDSKSEMVSSHDCLQGGSPLVSEAFRVGNTIFVLLFLGRVLGCSFGVVGAKGEATQGRAGCRCLLRGC